MLTVGWDAHRMHRLLRAALLAVMQAVPMAAQAHAQVDRASGVGWWSPWWTLVLLVALLALYLQGCRHRATCARWNGADTWRAIAFVTGMLVLALALAGPLDAWVAVSFAAHMAQHMALVVIAPPLLVAGRPRGMWLRALPRAAGRLVTVPVRAPVVGAAWRRFSASPAATAAVHAAALWAWHAPAAFEAALRHDGIHWLEHLTLLGTALLFWRALSSRRTAPWLSLGWLLFTLVHSGMLGALLTLAPAPLYPLYVERGSVAQALADQQFAGLVMWVPMGAAYLIAAVILAARALGTGAEGGVRAGT